MARLLCSEFHSWMLTTLTFGCSAVHQLAALTTMLGLLITGFISVGLVFTDTRVAYLFSVFVFLSIGQVIFNLALYMSAFIQDLIFVCLYGYSVWSLRSLLHRLYSLGLFTPPSPSYASTDAPAASPPLSVTAHCSEQQQQQRKPPPLSSSQPTQPNASGLFSVSSVSYEQEVVVVLPDTLPSQFSAVTLAGGPEVSATVTSPHDTDVGESVPGSLFLVIIACSLFLLCFAFLSAPFIQQFRLLPLLPLSLFSILIHQFVSPSSLLSCSESAHFSVPPPYFSSSLLLSAAFDCCLHGFLLIFNLAFFSWFSSFSPCLVFPPLQRAPLQSTMLTKCTSLQGLHP